MYAIEATNLTKTFPARGGATQTVEAVRGIDLQVMQGEIFGFLGPNGAGKTTTVRMLTTLAKPTGGSARVAGFDLATMSQQIRFVIGTALQDAGLDGMSTGRELLVMQARLHGLHAQAATRAAELLNVVGLTEAADRRISTYSGGMKRRLDLASALVHGPKLLFLDEPTAGLDPASRQAIWDEVVRLNREEGITVFLTTQYLEEADRLAHRVAIIDHGRIVADGTPESLKAAVGSEIISVTVSSDDVADATAKLNKIAGSKDSLTVEGTQMTLFVSEGTGTVTKVIRALDRAKIPLESITVTKPSLDEVFLRLTGSRLEGATDAADGDAAQPPGAEAELPPENLKASKRKARR